MFCIAAFIILAIISIFSASHRKLAKKAWSCTFRKITFRACDTSFKEETKSKLLSHVAAKTPRLVRAADVGIEIASFAFVILTIWSLLTAFEAGLNLFVWGTCTPSQASSCSLTSETCSIDKVDKSFWQLTSEGKPHEWIINQFSNFGNTVANIPNRLKTWNASEYLPATASYYYTKDDSKKTALEIIDPGCTVCARLFRNIKDAGFEKNYNLTYIAYPIKNPYEAGKYKFPNSYIITRYIESVKINPLGSQKTPADWQILERIYTWKDSENILYQTNFNSVYDQNQTIELLKKWLAEIGYSNEEIIKIEADANSNKVVNIINDNYKIVEDKVKTVQIPTIIFDSKKHDGLVKTSDLK